MSLPRPSKDVPLDASLDSLFPAMKERVEKLLALMAAKGQPSKVTETYRTNERQAFLYGFGREYDDGRGVVTHAPDASWSWHGYRLAADIVHHSLEWDAPQSYWLLLADCAEACGLRPGFRWRNPDRPHVQWHCDGMLDAPSPRARSLHAQGEAGLQTVAKELHVL